MIVDALIVNVTPGQTPGVARIYIYTYILPLHELWRFRNLKGRSSELWNQVCIATRFQADELNLKPHMISIQD